MSTAESFLLETGKFLLANHDIVEDVARALAAGTPKEAIRAAIRGAMIKVSDDALREELEAAEGRKTS
ncbi:MAG: hypothetical protein KF795_00345 [Labilithrix sp.]|nr:hypothetical protein [Labilithrix sp.]